MKKFFIFLIILLLIICTICYTYLVYQAKYNNAKQINAAFQKYYNKKIYGADLATAINKAIDYNTKNGIEKNKDSLFIENETNSIKIKYNSSLYNYYFTEAMPDDEKKSVDTYKGFYIGRYEAGDKESTEAKKLSGSNDVTKTVTIKKGQAPYNYVKKTQAVSLAEGFATKQGYKAKTKLVSSYAWDTTIAFLQKVNSDYGNSSEEGNYKDTTFPYTDITGASQTKASNSQVLVPTGQTTPVCNIYDMGGNVLEWTTESCSSTKYPYALRGGHCASGFANSPAGLRYASPDAAYNGLGFRLTLFM